MVDLVIIGAGALGREILALARACIQGGAELRVKGFLDRDPEALTGFDVAVPILADPEHYTPAPEDRFVIAVGDPGRRAAMAATVGARGGRLQTLVHPLAHLAGRAVLGPGCVICAFCFVAVDARLGTNVFLNNYASVGHDAVVGDHTVFSPYATVNGNVTLGTGCFLGTHATVTRGRRVGAWAKVTAGSVVYRGVPERALAHGNRAKSRVLS